MQTMKKILIWITLLAASLLLSGCFGNTQNSISPTENIAETTDTPNGEPKKILALWDSLTAWYNLPLEDSYPSQLEVLLQENWYNYELINGWVSWNTSSQALARVDIYLEDENNLPDLAIVVLWGNDGLQWKSIDALEQNITEIVKKLQEKWVEVVIWGMQIPPNRWLAYFLEFKWIYEDIAKATDSELIDFFLEDVATRGVYNLPDGIHPNKDGYAIIAENTFNFLENNKLITND